MLQGREEFPARVSGLGEESSPDTGQSVSESQWRDRHSTERAPAGREGGVLARGAVNLG